MEDEQVPDEEERTEAKAPAVPARPRRRLRRLLIALTVVSLLATAATLGLRHAYQGPRTLEEVVAAMPGVPLFPLSTVSPRNDATQRALALPLWVLRRQGARQADAALLSAPGESDFIVDWYLQAAPSQRWRLVKKDTVRGNTRLIFLRQREGLQVIVGPSNGLLAPVQLLYFEGLTEKHLRQLQQ